MPDFAAIFECLNFPVLCVAIVILETLLTWLNPEMTPSDPQGPNNDPSTEAKDNQGQQRASDSLIGAESLIKVDIVQDLKEQIKAANRDSRSHNEKQLYWTKAAAAVVLIYTLVTAAIWCTGRDTEKRQLRAYVGAYLINPVASLEKDGRLTMHMGVKNYGLTPAYNFQYVSGIGVMAYPLSDKTDWSFPESDSPSSLITLFPGALEGEWMKASLKGPIPPEGVELIRDGKSYRVMFWGTITYTDAFKLPHFTNFCVTEYGVPGVEMMPEICERHNESD